MLFVSGRRLANFSLVNRAVAREAVLKFWLEGAGCAQAPRKGVFSIVRYRCANTSRLFKDVRACRLRGWDQDERQLMSTHSDTVPSASGHPAVTTQVLLQTVSGLSQLLFPFASAHIILIPRQDDSVRKGQPHRASQYCIIFACQN